MPARLRLYLAISLDGFIASSDGGVAWLEKFPAEAFGFDEFLATIGTIVMGRAAYEQALGLVPWAYAGKRTIVMTSTPLDAPRPGVEAWRGEVANLAASLKRSSGGDVWLFGGAKSLQAFLARGLVDRIELFVIPTLLGTGIRLFENSAPVDLRLLEAKPRALGVVELLYEPATHRQS